MTKMIYVLLAAGFLASCNNDGKVTEGELDSLGNKIENKAEQVWDSTKETYKDIRNEVKEEVAERRDTTDRDDTTNRQ